MIDSTLPVLTTPASPSSAQCNTNGSDLTALNTWLTNKGGAVATDNCGTITWTNNFVAGSLTRGCSNSIPVTFTAADRCGNVVTTTASFTIVDTSAPTITTNAQTTSGECSASNTAFNTWLSNHGNAVATDVCFGSAGLTWTNNFSGSAPHGCGVSSGSVTFSVTDNCAQGNTARTTATWTSVDTQAPVITTQAQDLSISCTSQQSSSTAFSDWLASNGGAVATDACTAVTWTNTVSQSVNCVATTVTFIASDQCATPHQSRTTAHFSITDTTAPTFSNGPSSPTVECGPTAQSAFSAWLSSKGGATITDNCSSSAQITVTNDWPTGSLPPVNCLSTSVVHFTARDICGNTAVATGTFTISDTTHPVITTFPTNPSISCSSTSTSQYTAWVNSRGGAAASDCNSITWTNNAPAQPVFDGCTGTTTVTFVARDFCGLTTSATGSYTITDTASPALTTGAHNQTEECNGSGSQSAGVTSWVNSHGGAVATDSCSAVTWTNNFTGLTGGCVSVATVTFVASDGCGRTVSTTATYSLSDTTGPRITTQAQNKQVPCNDQTQAQAIAWLNSNGGAVATDTCDPQAVTWTHTLVGPIVSCDFATVTFTAMDGCGLSSSTTATFTSVDSTPPAFNPPASDTSVECNGSGNTLSYSAWIDSHGGAIASDSCALSFTWTNNAPAAGPVGCGVQTVTFTVTDSCHNSNRTTATFHVVDTLNPTISPVPTDLSVECDGTGNQSQLNAWIANHGGASAVDVCSQTLTWTVTTGTQTGNSCASSKPYTFRVQDGCGKISSATANFIVIDTTTPTLTTPVSDASYECDGNGNVNQIQQWINSHGGAVARDQCQSSIVWTNDYSGSGPFTCTSTLVTFTISDGCGNIISDDGVIEITDSHAPVFTVFPDDVTVPCDADVTTEALGKAIAVDACAGEVVVSLDEFFEDEPPVGDCPGDHIITRRWSTADECGNAVTQDQIITVNIVRSSGPCDPEGCVCNECCPPPAATDCLPAPCNAVACVAAPCQAAACICPTSTAKMAEARGDLQVPEDLIQPLPQCKPVYIYVNDDDDSTDAQPAVYGEPSNQRMIVTNEPLHENSLKNKSAASALTVSFVLVLLAVLSLF